MAEGAAGKGDDWGAAESTWAPGKRVGRYEVLRPLGAGGMSRVYEGIHPELKKRVAIKVLHDKVAGNDEARARFLREGEAASKIRHPNVVEIFDVGLVDDFPYLVMELLEGEDLSEMLAREARLDATVAVDLMLPVFAAVASAHEEGVLHRDLKPANIFLVRSRRGVVQPKLLDFGISRMTGGGDHRLTQTASLLGTPYYVSPEQAKGAKDVDARSDQYALGVILYECLTGEVPFEDESLYGVLHKVVSGQFTGPSQLVSMPPGLEDVIVRAMSNDRSDRYDGVEAMALALLPFASERSRAIWEPAFAPHEDDDDEHRFEGAPTVRVADTTGVHTTRPGVGFATSGGAGAAASSTSVIRSRRGPALPTGPGDDAAAIGDDAGSLPTRQGPGKFVLAGAAALALLAAVGGWFAFGRGDAASSSAGTFRVQVTGNPEDARFELDGQHVATGAIDVELPRDGRDHRLVVTATGHETRSLTFSEDAPPPAQVTLGPTLPVGVDLPEGSPPSPPTAAAGGSPPSSAGADAADTPAAQTPTGATGTTTTRAEANAPPGATAAAAGKDPTPERDYLENLPPPPGQDDGLEPEVAAAADPPAAAAVEPTSAPPANAEPSGEPTRPAPDREPAAAPDPPSTPPPAPVEQGPTAIPIIE